MDPEELIGCEVIAVNVNKQANYFTLVFDNGHKVEIQAPTGGSIEDSIEECN